MSVNDHHICISNFSKYKLVNVSAVVDEYHVCSFIHLVIHSVFYFIHVKAKYVYIFFAKSLKLNFSKQQQQQQHNELKEKLAG